MRPRDVALAAQLNQSLNQYSAQHRPLPGIASQAERDSLIEQLLESIHRIQYTQVIQRRAISLGRTNPALDIFDPLKAALIMDRNGNHDEACWLVFLSVHFGKNLKSNWELPRNFYGKLGQGGIWDWQTVVANPNAVRLWLGANLAQLNSTGNFGNHRKYQTNDVNKKSNTADAIESYVAWVQAAGSHRNIVRNIHQQKGQNPRDTFNHMYKSMKVVKSFGRTAKFDFLTMIGKLGLAPIEPGSVYMNGATGPFEGAKRLFGTPNARWQDLENWLEDLDAVMGQHFGMQVLEDALCNWQKSPYVFVPFRG